MPDPAASGSLPDFAGAAGTEAGLEDHLRALIHGGGPLTLDAYMGAVLTHPEFGYYSATEPFGEAGDFITAPEVSQMFGELIGAWCAHTWAQMGSPGVVRLVEMGPGRGTMMVDLLRAAAKVPKCLEAVDIHLIEASGRLAALQQEALAGHGATWHESLGEVPDGPMILVANEFLDALPIRQFERTAEGWCERLVDWHGGGFRFVLSRQPSPAAALIPDEVRGAPVGSVAEVCPAALALCADIARRLGAHGGAALFIDYGADAFAPRDTLQAVAHHKPHPVLEAPGHRRPLRPRGFRASCPCRRPSWRRRVGTGDPRGFPHPTGHFRPRRAAWRRRHRGSAGGHPLGA